MQHKTAAVAVVAVSSGPHLSVACDRKPCERATIRLSAVTSSSEYLLRLRRVVLSYCSTPARASIQDRPRAFLSCSSTIQPAERVVGLIPSAGGAPLQSREAPAVIDRSLSRLVRSARWVTDASLGLLPFEWRTTRPVPVTRSLEVGRGGGGRMRHRRQLTRGRTVRPEGGTGVFAPSSEQGARSPAQRTVRLVRSEGALPPPQIRERIAPGGR